MADNQSMVAGLFATPEQYQQGQLAQQQALAAQMAQLTPEQQANAGMRVAGYQLGGGIAGAFGAQDPMLKLQAARQQILQNVDQTNPDSVMQAAQRLSQIGDQQGAMQLAQLARTANAELIKARQAESVIKKNENWQATQADAEKKRNVVAEVEDKLSRGEQVDNVTLNKAKLAFGDISRPKTFQQADGTIAVIPPTVDASMFPNIGKYMSSASQGVGGKAGIITTPAAQEAAQTQAETAKEAVATVQNAINKVDEAATLYKNSKTAGGYGQLLSNIPMTDAKSLANLTSNIKSAFSVEEIAKLKAQSKTGATGFGSLAVKELETIQNAVTALDPADQKFPEQLKTIRESFDRWKKLMETRSARAEAKVSGSPDVAPKPSPMSGKNPQLQPSGGEEALISKNMAANKGYTRAEVISELIKNKKLPAGYQ